ncbi:hypothetical protein IC582_001517 [Cucumis melo]
MMEENSRARHLLEVFHTSSCLQIGRSPPGSRTHVFVPQLASRQLSENAATFQQHISFVQHHLLHIKIPGCSRCPWQIFELRTSRTSSLTCGSTDVYE